MQAIRVKYLGPTNYRGTRLKATTSSGESLTIGRDHAVDVKTDERRVARALCQKLGWSNCHKLLRGGFGDESVFVFLPESCSCPSSAFQGMRKRSRPSKRR